MGLWTDILIGTKMRVDGYGRNSLPCDGSLTTIPSKSFLSMSCAKGRVVNLIPSEQLTEVSFVRMLTRTVKCGHISIHGGCLKVQLLVMKHKRKIYHDDMAI